MNKIFKVIWDQATQSWVAVSELAKGRTKSRTPKLNSKIGKSLSVNAILGSVSSTMLVAGSFVVTPVDTNAANLNTGRDAYITINQYGYSAYADEQSIAIGAEANASAGFSGSAQALLALRQILLVKMR